MYTLHQKVIYHLLICIKMSIKRNMMELMLKKETLLEDLIDLQKLLRE